MALSGSREPNVVPVLLLKTRSSPHDPYEDLFLSSDAAGGPRFAPRFVPVLSHRLEAKGTARLATLLQHRQIGPAADSAFGGLILTSQRAVEALAKIVADGKDCDLGAPSSIDSPCTPSKPRCVCRPCDHNWPHLQDVPVYSVGPATARALAAVRLRVPLQVFGQHCGNGEALSHFILGHYAKWYSHRPTRPPLLFLVGEQRRDVIPRTLMDTARPVHERITVDEEVVYGTAVMESFPNDFADALRKTKDAPCRWVVVFSPTGCDSMLCSLGILDPTTGCAESGWGDGTTFIATIGPTTKAYMAKTFNFEPDVCANTPTPSGVLQAIQEHMRWPPRT
ncbi:hypothetical protein CDD83_4258 [Cordyceps sp. RAO-2017]|nr:hypothetical protein CDD83_4258 [Cordyceps sp. RAO-2017]